MPSDPLPPQPDPMPDPTPEQLASGSHSWFRLILGVVLLGSLLVVIVRGIYVAWQVQPQGP